MNKIKILFLCTGNSCRSQMAEGWARFILPQKIEAYSAGIEAHGLNPNAVAVMKEAGVDISYHKSKTINELRHEKFDYVITVCDNAKENCPFFPAIKELLHVSFNDPPLLAEEEKKRGGSIEEQLDCYRKVRDEIKNFIQNLPEHINLS